MDKGGLMANLTAKEYIQLQQIEESRQSNIRSLWQDTADIMYPYVQIVSTYESGTPRTKKIYDMTPYLDMCDMVSGLKFILIPMGQNFFAVKSAITNLKNDNAQRYLSLVTETAHEKIFASNFITEFDEVLRNLIIFGPATIYSEWTKKTGLNYKTAEIGSHQFLEDNSKRVESVIIKFQMSAKNAYKEFKGNVGKLVQAAYDKPETRNNKFWFIHCVMPREGTNKNLSDRYNMNMAYESVFIDVIDEMIVDEGGFIDNPYSSARWMRPASEKDGRGIGTEILPQIKVLQKMTYDFVHLSNKFGDPPLEKVSNNVEGDVNTKPGAVNEVSEIGSIRAIEGNALGNFPITEKSLDRQTEIIHRAFFRNAFSPLEDLTGDRRTTLEIRERIKQSWPKIGPPVSRIWTELLSPLITRSIMLLIRNGEIPLPPQELQGTNFGIEFVGPFALELRSQQAKAFQEWASFVGSMEEVFPGAVDNVDPDDAIMRMGRTFGVNTEDMATEEERLAKRQSRIEQQAKMEQVQAIESASNAYGKGTKAPEEGSAVKKIMEGIGV